MIAHLDADAVILDLETGGYGAEVCAITSVGMMLIDKWLDDYATYYQLVKDDPDRVYHPDAERKTGIGRVRCQRSGMPVDRVLAGVKRTIEGKLVIGHNFDFDIRFLANRGITISRYICTDQMWRNVRRGKKISLINMCKALDVEVGMAHHAMGDVYMTAAALKAMAGRPEFEPLKNHIIVT